MFESFKNYVDIFEQSIEVFGGVSRGKKKYVLRKNINNPFPESGAYFGCINEGEEPSGAYSDLSIVVFPSNEDSDADDRWLISLGVGSLGYKNDYQLASLPGIRRMFVNCLGKDSFVKNDFLDIESQDGFSHFCKKSLISETLSNAVKSYGKVILACTITDPNNKDSCLNTIMTFLAIYAALRKWPTNDKQRNTVKAYMSNNKGKVDDKERLLPLLEKRKYIVIQGAPGTGKTRMAKELVKGSNNVFFTQFHAETAFCDFVYGIIPDTSAGTLKYTSKKGVFVQAIEKAMTSDEKVYLIIDEINRANLSNVLGPAFYLFEPSMSGSGIEIEVCPGLSIEKLPDNLYIIATMNTADRSLAVVDFALRRRFAWYTMYPHEISADSGKKFSTDEFKSISDIFELYASDEELSLQPGQAYFIVSENNADEEIKDRLRYEVMPLIKEYLSNGMLSRAKDDFVNYFRSSISEEMYL